MKILSRTDEPLLSRTKVEAEIQFDGATISRDELRKQLSQNLKADEKLLDIKNIRTLFGHRKAKAIAYLYRSEDDLKKLSKKAKKTGKENAPKEKKQ